MVENEIGFYADILKKQVATADIKSEFIFIIFWYSILYLASMFFIVVNKKRKTEFNFMVILVDLLSNNKVLGKNQTLFP